MPRQQIFAMAFLRICRERVSATYMPGAAIIVYCRKFSNIDMRRNALRLLTPYDNLRYALRRLFAHAAAITLLCGVVGGCALFVPWSQLYSGSGVHVKGRGMYQVRILEVPLDRPSFGCATLSQLGPEWEWVVGINVEAVEGETDRMYTADTYKLKSSFVPRANIELILLNEARETVFSVSGPLNEWDWNWNRARREGSGEQFKSAPGTYSFRRFDVGPDGGWGSSFTPRFSATYSLCYRVIEPAPIPLGTAVWLTAETYWGSL
jgi:hypothetical protein